MNKTLFALAFAALSFSACADSVYQWGAWDTSPALPPQTQPTVATTKPVVTTVSATSTVPADVVQLVGSSGAGPVVDQSIISDLAALKAGNVVATFTGEGSFNAPVTITTDFGKSTWRGEWSMTFAAGVGTERLNAAGAISGTAISGSFTPGENSLIASGSVNGQFSGRGVTAITGSTTMVTVGGASFADTFAVRR